MSDEYIKIVERAIKYHGNQGHLRIVEALKGVRTRMLEQRKQDALDKMAQNARELGLTYEEDQK